MVPFFVMVLLGATWCCGWCQQLRGERQNQELNRTSRTLACTPERGGCWLREQCCDGLTCQPFDQRCYQHPRQDGQPCSTGFPCAHSADRVLQCRGGLPQTCVAAPFEEVVPSSATRRYVSLVQDSNDTSFAVIVLSDVQFAFTDCKFGRSDETIADQQRRLQECIFGSEEAADDADSQRRSRILVDANRAMLRRAQEVIAESGGKHKAIVMNGDMVNYGSDWVLRQYLEIFGKHALQVPLFAGMGNHDVETEINSQAVRMMQYFVGEMETLHRMGLLRTLDGRRTQTFYDAANVRLERHYAGSWAYAFDMGRYTFLQLNNPAYTQRNGVLYNGEEFTRYAEDWNVDAGRQDFFHFTSVAPWLVEELDLAKAKGQHVVLMTHSFQAIRAMLQSTPVHEELARRIDNSTIFVLISGHIHTRYGLWLEALHTPVMTRDIPVLYAGSPHYQKFLDLRFMANGSGLEFQVVDVKVGRTTPCQVGVAFGCDSLASVKGFISTTVS